MFDKEGLGDIACPMFSLLVIAASWKESQCVAGQKGMVRLSICFTRAASSVFNFVFFISIKDFSSMILNISSLTLVPTAFSATVQLGQLGLQLGDLVPVLGLLHLHLRLLNEQVRPHLSQLLLQLQVLLQQRIILLISSFNQDCLFPAPKRNIEI